MSAAPHDLGDLRERCQQALERLADLRNKAARMHHTSEYDRLCGKTEGVELVMSYLDEVIRERTGA